MPPDAVQLAVAFVTFLVGRSCSPGMPGAEYTPLFFGLVMTIGAAVAVEPTVPHPNVVPPTLTTWGVTSRLTRRWRDRHRIARRGNTRKHEPGKECHHREGERRCRRRPVGSAVRCSGSHSPQVVPLSSLEQRWPRPLVTHAAQPPHAPRGARLPCHTIPGRARAPSTRRHAAADGSAGARSSCRPRPGGRVRSDAFDRRDQLAVFGHGRVPVLVGGLEVGDVLPALGDPHRL